VWHRERSSVRRPCGRGKNASTLRLGRKVDPSAVPPAFGVAAALWPTGPSSRMADRCCRDIAGALRRNLLGGPHLRRTMPLLEPFPLGPEAPGSIPHPLRTGLTPTAGSLPRGSDGYSSRSSPALQLSPAYALSGGQSNARMPSAPRFPWPPGLSVAAPRLQPGPGAPTGTPGPADNQVRSAGPAALPSRCPPQPP
jgi:hypothetical protein